MTTIPRPEFPRPQFFRGDDKWINLNGEWEFEFDFGKSGKQRGFEKTDAPFTRRINVPFCPESKLSGIEYVDFIPQCWYRRDLPVPDGFDASRERLILHFGAVDYKATVYLNGTQTAEHTGGYTPFSVDLTDRLAERNTITVCAFSDVRSDMQPTGKQSDDYKNHDCVYTRNTGIWQTVWLERVPRSYIEKVAILPDVKNEKVVFRVTAAGDLSCGSASGSPLCGSQGEITARVSYKGAPVVEASAKLTGKNAVFEAAIPDPVLWDVGRGELYDVRFTFGDDTLDSYFGMRSFEVDGDRVLLNGRPYFMRTVLDQGYYPDGVVTAPTDDDLRRDIELSMEAGFEGARLHMKVFEPRLIYHADRAGYLLWGEYPSWGLNTGSDRAMEVMLPEWLAEVERDISSPAIIGWCPNNESAPWRDERLFRTLYDATHAIDPTRPVIDTSGYFHVVTDIFDTHHYEQDPARFAELYGAQKMAKGDFYITDRRREHYDGQPYFVSEYGGTAFVSQGDRTSAWGYGEGVKDDEEFYERLRGLTEVLTSNPLICGYCYTQLTDVFQEVNGIYKFDRTPKFDPARLREIFGMEAAITKR